MVWNLLLYCWNQVYKGRPYEMETCLKGFIYHLIHAYYLLTIQLPPQIYYCNYILFKFAKVWKPIDLKTTKITVKRLSEKLTISKQFETNFPHHVKYAVVLSRGKKQHFLFCNSPLLQEADIRVLVLEFYQITLI